MRSVLWLFDPALKQALSIAADKCTVREIRMRSGKPLALTCDNGTFFLKKNGLPTRTANDTLICSCDDIKNTVMRACNGSVYSCQEQINRGFITISGGHRIGICGTAVYTDGVISCIKQISALNIRIAKQYFGAADELCEVFKRYGVRNTLIVGTVSSGKTTVLRDIARSLSSDEGFMKTVCVIDERNEICGYSGGKPSFDTGAMCDCLSGYKKADGIDIAVRTMSPDIIVFDELSGSKELSAVDDCFNCGVNVIASVHAKDEDDFCRKPLTQHILKTGCFDYFVFLENCRISKIAFLGDIHV